MQKPGNIFFFYCILFVLLQGCANIVTPSGGDKDAAPPKILKLVPENQSLNFAEKSFVISFDEYIQLNDISAQLIVSPPLKTAPEFVIKGKNLLVKFQDELLPNTTYTMNFGNAIQDLNENNPLENFTYVFSTGSFIDSLSLNGNVKNAFTLENEKDVLVLLYEENSDSLPYLKLPYYYAKTNASGNFALGNLKEGKFKIVALKDQNSDFLYDDFDKETIGFLDTLVVPYYLEKPKPEVKDSLEKSKTDSVPGKNTDAKLAGKEVKLADANAVSLYVFQEEKNKQFLKKAYSEHYGKLVFVFNRKPKELVLNTLNTSFKKEWNIIEYTTTGDTVFAWLSDVEMDSLKLEIIDNGIAIDTAEIALKKRSDKVEVQSSGKKTAGKSSKPFKLSVEQGKGITSHNPAKSFFITFNHPVKDYDLTKFILKEENDTVKFTLDSKDAAMRKYSINYKWKEEKKYEFFIPPGVVTDIFDLKNDTIKINFTTQAKTYFGNVALTLKAPAANYILQLTDEKNNIVLEKPTTGNEKFQFDGLDPKSYGLRLIVDENKNGKWDTGNYLQKRQAERIILNQQKVNVRSNWDVDVEWEVK